MAELDACRDVGLWLFGGVWLAVGVLLGAALYATFVRPPQ